MYNGVSRQLLASQPSPVNFLPIAYPVMLSLRTFRFGCTSGGLSEVLGRIWVGKPMPQEHLTERRVQSAMPQDGQARLELRDTKVRGLELRVGHAAKKWSLLYTRRSDSKFRRLSLGSYPELSLADARKKALSLKAEIEDGADPATGIRINGRVIRLPDRDKRMMTDYLADAQ